MELDDLKKTWGALDKQLEKQELIAGEELLNLIRQKKDHTNNTISTILKSNRITMITTILLLCCIIFLRVYDGVFLSEPYFWTLAALLPPAFAWSIYTMYYLKKTKIDEMPLATVIERVNRYNYWMSMERILGTILLFIFALIYMVSTDLWHAKLSNQIVIISIWAVGFIIYFFIINRYVFRHLKKIRKNLNELKELKSED